MTEIGLLKIKKIYLSNRRSKNKLKFQNMFSQEEIGKLPLALKALVRNPTLRTTKYQRAQIQSSHEVHSFLLP